MSKTNKIHEAVKEYLFKSFGAQETYYDSKVAKLFAGTLKEAQEERAYYLVGAKGSEYETPVRVTNKEKFENLKIKLANELSRKKYKKGRIADFFKNVFILLSSIDNISKNETFIICLLIINAVCENDMSVLYVENVTNILSEYGIFETTQKSREFMVKLLAKLRQELPALARDMEIYLIRLEECC